MNWLRFAERVLERGDVGERRDPAEDARGEQEQEGRQPEARNAEPDQAADARADVVAAVALDGGEHAEGHADERRDQKREDDELERDRHRVADDVRDRLGVAERVAEVSLQDATDPAPVLLRVGAVQAELLARLLLDLLARGLVAAEEDVDDVARQQPDHEEDPDRDDEERRDRSRNPPEDVAGHPGSCLPGPGYGRGADEAAPLRDDGDAVRQLLSQTLRSPVLKSLKATYMFCTRLRTTWYFLIATSGICTGLSRSSRCAAW